MLPWDTPSHPHRDLEWILTSVYFASFSTVFEKEVNRPIVSQATNPYLNRIVQDVLWKELMKGKSGIY